MTHVIESALRDLISDNLRLTDTYKMALGTIVEQRACIEDWQRRSQQWCSKCDKARELEACETSRRELTLRLVDARSEASKAKSDMAEMRGELRDAFLDGANWLEHRLRDKPLSAYYTRMAWEEACKRWGEEGRDEQS